MKKLIIIAAAVMLTSPAWAIVYTGNSDYTNPYSSDAYTRALWHFDENTGDTIAIDASPNNNDADSENTVYPPTGAPYSFGNELWQSSMTGFDTCFDWDDGYGRFEADQSTGGPDTNTTLDIGGNDLTIEFWMNPSSDAGSGWARTILEKDTGGDYKVMQNINQIWFTCWDGIQRYVGDTTTIPLNDWTHVLIQMDRESSETNDTVEFYINGQLSTTHTFGNVTSTSPGQSLWLAGRTDGHLSFSYRGSLDEVRISDVLRVPEPTTISLLAIAALAFLRRKK